MPLLAIFADWLGNDIASGTLFESLLCGFIKVQVFEARLLLVRVIPSDLEVRNKLLSET